MKGFSNPLWTLLLGLSLPLRGRADAFAQVVGAAFQEALALVPLALWGAAVGGQRLRLEDALGPLCVAANPTTPLLDFERNGERVVRLPPVCHGRRGPPWDAHGSHRPGRALACISQALCATRGAVVSATNSGLRGADCVSPERSKITPRELRLHSSCIVLLLGVGSRPGGCISPTFFPIPITRSSTGDSDFAATWRDLLPATTGSVGCAWGLLQS